MESVSKRGRTPLFTVLTMLFLLLTGVAIGESHLSICSWVFHINGASAFAGELYPRWKQHCDAVSYRIKKASIFFKNGSSEMNGDPGTLRLPLHEGTFSYQPPKHPRESDLELERRAIRFQLDVRCNIFAPLCTFAQIFFVVTWGESTSTSTPVPTDNDNASCSTFPAVTASITQLPLTISLVPRLRWCDRPFSLRLRHADVALSAFLKWRDGAMEVLSGAPSGLWNVIFDLQTTCVTRVESPGRSRSCSVIQTLVLFSPIPPLPSLPPSLPRCRPVYGFAVPLRGVGLHWSLREVAQETPCPLASPPLERKYFLQSDRKDAISTRFNKLRLFPNGTFSFISISKGSDPIFSFLFDIFCGNQLLCGGTAYLEVTSQTTLAPFTSTPSSTSIPQPSPEITTTMSPESPECEGAFVFQLIQPFTEPFWATLARASDRIDGSWCSFSARQELSSRDAQIKLYPSGDFSVVATRNSLLDSLSFSFERVCTVKQQVSDVSNTSFASDASGTSAKAASSAEASFCDLRQCRGIAKLHFLKDPVLPDSMTLTGESAPLRRGIIEVSSRLRCQGSCVDGGWALQPGGVDVGSALGSGVKTSNGMDAGTMDLKWEGVTFGDTQVGIQLFLRGVIGNLAQWFPTLEPIAVAGSQRPDSNDTANLFSSAAVLSPLLQSFDASCVDRVGTTGGIAAMWHYESHGNITTYVGEGHTFDGMRYFQRFGGAHQFCDVFRSGTCRNAPLLFPSEVSPLPWKMDIIGCDATWSTLITPAAMLFFFKTKNADFQGNGWSSLVVSSEVLGPASLHTHTAGTRQRVQTHLLHVQLDADDTVVAPIGPSFFSPVILHSSLSGVKEGTVEWKLTFLLAKVDEKDGEELDWHALALRNVSINGANWTLPSSCDFCDGVPMVVMRTTFNEVGGCGEFVARGANDTSGPPIDEASSQKAWQACNGSWPSIQSVTLRGDIQAARDNAIALRGTLQLRLTLESGRHISVRVKMQSRVRSAALDVVPSTIKVCEFGMASIASGDTRVHDSVSGTTPLFSYRTAAIYRHAAKYSTERTFESDSDDDVSMKSISTTSLEINGALLCAPEDSGGNQVTVDVFGWAVVQLPRVDVTHISVTLVAEWKDITSTDMRGTARIDLYRSAGASETQMQSRDALPWRTVASMLNVRRLVCSDEERRSEVDLPCALVFAPGRLVEPSVRRSAMAVEVRSLGLASPSAVVITSFHVIRPYTFTAAILGSFRPVVQQQEGRQQTFLVLAGGVVMVIFVIVIAAACLSKVFLRRNLVACASQKLDSKSKVTSTKRDEKPASFEELSKKRKPAEELPRSFI